MDLGLGCFFRLPKRKYIERSRWGLGRRVYFVCSAQRRLALVWALNGLRGGLKGI